MVGIMSNHWLVIPCYNEERRFDRAQAAELRRLMPTTQLLLVDDGSSDATLEMMHELAQADPDGIAVLALEHGGKAEAVRLGMLEGLRQRASIVGYLDADFSTPASEVPALLETLNDAAVDAAIGSRVALLGRQIYRRPLRHYLGRLFATLASLALQMTVYDTQCGAKLFRRTPALYAALATPFRGRWTFDVELLARLAYGVRGSPAAGAIVEVPLHKWRDVGGSRIRPLDLIHAAWDLVRVAVDVRRARRGSLSQ